MTIKFKGNDYEGSMQAEFYIVSPIYLEDLKIEKEQIKKDEEFDVTVKVNTENTITKIPISKMDLVYSYNDDNVDTQESILKQTKYKKIDDSTYVFTYNAKELKKGWRYELEGVTLYDNKGNVDGVRYYYRDYGSKAIMDVGTPWTSSDYYDGYQKEIDRVRFNVEGDEEPEQPPHHHVYKKVVHKASPGKMQKSMKNVRDHQ